MYLSTLYKFCPYSALYSLLAYLCKFTVIKHISTWKNFSCIFFTTSIQRLHLEVRIDSKVDYNFSNTAPVHMSR